MLHFLKTTTTFPQNQEEIEICKLFAKNESHRDDCITFLRETLTEFKKSNETFILTILGLIISACGLLATQGKISNTNVLIFSVCIIFCLGWFITKVIMSEKIESLLSKRQEDRINNYIVLESLKKVKKTKKIIDFLLVIIIVSLLVTLLYNLYTT